MKLTDKDERYVFECCQYRIHVDNRTATVAAKSDKDRLWFLPFWGELGKIRLEAKFCPECGSKIPKLEEEKETR